LCHFRCSGDQFQSISVCTTDFGGLDTYLLDGSIDNLADCFASVVCLATQTL